MKVSICIPIYGVEQYIERCARSVLEQTYPNIEYIFVNDCTKDSSLEILNKVIEDYPERLPSIKVISHEKNRGLAAARNTAIENCTGDFVMHVDSDDYIEKNAVALLVNKQRETDADIVSCDILKETKNGETLISEPDYHNKEEMILQCIKPTLDHGIVKRLIRLKLYNDYHIKAKEGVNVGEDWQVMPQLIYYANKIAKIDDVIYHYNCMNEGSYMSQKDAELNKKTVFQDVGSLDILENFFIDKEVKYLSEVRKVKLDYLHWYLEKAYNGNNSEIYNYIAQRISKMDNTYLSYIGWDNPKALFVNRNYYIRRLYESFI